MIYFNFDAIQIEPIAVASKKIKNLKKVIYFNFDASL